MAIRRTKKDKQNARLKIYTKGETYSGFKFEVNTKENADNSRSFFTPELSLSMNVIKADLTRTVLVTILALLLQTTLYVYLQRGGWEKLLPFLSKISL